MNEPALDLKRRKFLKYLLFGSGSLLLGGLVARTTGIGDELSKYAKPMRSFKVLEKDKSLIFYNSAGHRLFTVYDNGDLEISS